MSAFFMSVVAFFTSLATIVTSFLGFDIGSKEKQVENFKVTTYIRGDYIQEENSLYSEDFDIVTDVILFECASFDNNGNVVYEKDKLETALKNIRNAIGERDVIETVNINNVPVDISIPDLRIVLIIYSFYINYCEYMNSVIRLDDFYEKMKEQKNVFEGLDEMQIKEKFELFVHMIPILQQIKEY